MDEVTLEYELYLISSKMTSVSEIIQTILTDCTHDDSKRVLQAFNQTHLMSEHLEILASNLMDIAHNVREGAE